MEQKKYQLAGWLSMVAAVIFPFAYLTGILLGVISLTRFHRQVPSFNISDLMMIVFTVIFVYVMLAFKKMLNERYNFHGIDALIVLSIIWSIVYQIVSINMSTTILIISPSDIFYTILIIVFLAFFMITIGIIDLFIAIRLLKIKESLSDLLKVFAYLSLIAGICELTVILSPVLLVLLPIYLVVMGMIFFKEDEGVEFV